MERFGEALRPAWRRGTSREVQRCGCSTWPRNASASTTLRDPVEQVAGPAGVTVSASFRASASTRTSLIAVRVPRACTEYTERLPSLRSGSRRAPAPPPRSKRTCHLLCAGLEHDPRRWLVLFNPGMVLGSRNCNGAFWIARSCSNRSSEERVTGCFLPGDRKTSGLALPMLGWSRQECWATTLYPDPLLNQFVFQRPGGRRGWSMSGRRSCAAAPAVRCVGA